MHVVMVAWRVKPEAISAFAARVGSQALASLAEEEGCRRFDVAQSTEDPARFLLYEIYDTQKDFEDHGRTPHFLSFSADVVEMTLEKTVQQFTLLRV
ncbi:MAG: antibiotic biosynthesis monooxygenase family protein [Pseudomonadota bacterium]